MADFKTPGVYIEEKNAFPNSVIAVATAIPVFIGYTEKAERKGKSLHRVPTKISSLTEYTELFGGAPLPHFDITPKTAATSADDIIKLNGNEYCLVIQPGDKKYFYFCLRLFYLNGGASCYIMSVGNYSSPVSIDDFINGDPSVFDILAKEWEPTLVVAPDAVVLPAADYYTVCKQMLNHCHAVQNRFAIFDVLRTSGSKTNVDIITEFRQNTGTDFLNYGAAYYPWLKSAVLNDADISFNNLSDWTILKTLIPAAEQQAHKILDKGPGEIIQLTIDEYNAAVKKDPTKVAPTLNKENAIQKQNVLNFHQSLIATSATYKIIMAGILAKLNILPPAAAMAGIYTFVDGSRGVWKSPANVSVAGVTAPEITISSDEQQGMNVDPVSGKSINVIRSFAGQGTLVWGGRTLDGNSQDWRYINVRRTMIMIEQSLKLATRAYVFEPNDAGTWTTLRSMMTSFLFNLWKQGGLAGATSDQAFSVEIGLGSTMTPEDILDGLLNVTVKLAIVRPAEFIVITFQQQQQKS